MNLRHTTATISTPLYSLTRDTVLVMSFALLTALAAQVQIPLTPVPMTLQTLVVVLSGMLLGARRGALSQVAYIGAGLAGAPFFAQYVGLAILTRPSAGYLVGFIPSAFLAGLMGAALAKKHLSLGRRFAWHWAAAFVASLPCLFLGATWLKLWLGQSWSSAVMLGIVPFLVGDFIKTTIVALITSGTALKK